MHLEHGRPRDIGARLSKEAHVYDLLDRLNIDYDRIDHEATPSIEACQGVDEMLQTHICKNLFLCNAQRTQFYLLLMPGEKKFRTAVLSKQIGSSRLSFADEAHMQELMDLTPGSVTVLGLMNDGAHRVRLLIDGDVLEEELFACHPCINTSSLRFRTQDLTQRILPALGIAYTVVTL